MRASRDAASWQLILADLSLILFLVAINAVATDQPVPPQIPAKAPATVPAQALYRPGDDAPEIGDWLEQQSPDPRMAVTIVATHKAGGAVEAWRRAEALAGTARETGWSVRIVIREGAESDLYASLGFDDPQ